tara:strand:- start:1158 stop:2117 length:960 start_codon:yes stop_codon:yes gene_type:complete
MINEKVLMSILRLLKILSRSYLLPNTKTYSEYGRKGLIKNTARYCYSVWLRHIVIANKNGLNTKPKSVAEIGPGDSLGMALCALITGVEEYTIFDSQKNINKEVNYKILDDLIVLFRNMEDIPNEYEFPEIRPKLDNYNFPREILSKSYLKKMLSNERLKNIRRYIDSFNSNNSKIKYIFNFEKKIISQFDLFISQAVLEHIDNLDEFFFFMRNALKENGYVSHQIDLKSHNISSKWDGHWQYSKIFWKVLRGNRLWFINRYTYSDYIKLFDKNRFRTLFIDRNIKIPSFNKSKLAKEFKYMSDIDRHTSGFFIQAEIF